MLAGATALAIISQIASTILGLGMAYNARAAARADRQRLWQSLFQQARAERQAGNRWQALEQITEAAEMEVSGDLRQEAIQTITSSGMRLIQERSARFPSNTEWSKIPGILPSRFTEFDFNFPKGPHELDEAKRIQIWDELKPLLKTEGLWAHSGDNFTHEDGMNVYTAWKADEAGNWTNKRAGVFLWQPGRDKVISLPAAADPEGLRMSGDRTWLAFRDNSLPDLIHLWDCRRERLHGRLEGRGEPALFRTGGSYPGVEFSPDSLLLASTHWRNGRPVLRIDEVMSCRPTKTLPDLIPIAWASDGQFLLTLVCSPFLGPPQMGVHPN